MSEYYSLLGIAEDAYACSVRDDPARPLLRTFITKLINGCPFRDALDEPTVQALQRLRGKTYAALADQYRWPLDRASPSYEVSRKFTR